MSVSQRNLIANRRNAQMSTGPRTPAGKAISSQNGMKHGLYSEHLRLRPLDLEWFELTRQWVLGLLKPVGPQEQVIAERFVVAVWKLKMAARLTQAPEAGNRRLKRVLRECADALRQLRAAHRS